MAQHGSNAVSDLNKLKKFSDDLYRESYLDSHVKSSIAYQIQALREKARLNQSDFGKLVGKPQSVISRLENTEYGGVNVNTLLQIANRLKIGLLVRFCDFDAILDLDVGPESMKVENIEETLRRVQQIEQTLKRTVKQLGKSVSATPMSASGSSQKKRASRRSRGAARE
jgi:transcriptional regulator with XRE-family HTH domain